MIIQVSWVVQFLKRKYFLLSEKMKHRGAAGPDGLLGDLKKNYSDEVVNFLTELFNTLFDKDVSPKNWTESVLLPLYEKGCVNSTNNYTAICFK